MAVKPQESTRGPASSQSTKTTPRQGQNKPQPGGTAGAGKARGAATLPNTTRTTQTKR